MKTTEFLTKIWLFLTVCLWIVGMCLLIKAGYLMTEYGVKQVLSRAWEGPTYVFIVEPDK